MHTEDRTVSTSYRLGFCGSTNNFRLHEYKTTNRTYPAKHSISGRYEDAVTVPEEGATETGFEPTSAASRLYVRNPTRAIQLLDWWFE